MSSEREDHWSRIEAPGDVERAVERLAQIAEAPSEKRARARFLELLGPKPGQEVLDVGAGTGVIALELARRVAPTGRVVALDPSRALLEIALAAARDAGLSAVVDTEVADARKLPYADHRFDHALCHWVLLHVSQPERAIAEMLRVVKSGGRVMCVECDWETAVVHPGDKSVTRRILHASCDRHVDGWMGRRLRGLLLAAGLVDVEVEPIVDVETGEHPAFVEYLRSRVAIAVQAESVSPTEAEAWWAEIDSARTNDRLFFSVTQFAVWGATPGGRDAALGAST